MGAFVNREGYPHYGYETWPDRKRPVIVKRDGNRSISYGYFRDEKCAEEWFNGLVELIMNTGDAND